MLEQFNEIYNNICKTEAEAKKLEKAENNLIEKRYGDHKAALKDHDVEALHSIHEKYEKQIIEIDSKYSFLTFAITVLKNNAKIALYNDVISDICEVIAKYDGKSYGPKTSDKIKEEIQGKTGCYFYINGERYTQYYSVRPVDPYWGFDITIGTDNFNEKKLLTEKNKVVAYDVSELRLQGIKGEFIENISSFFEQCQEAYREAKEAIEAYNKAYAKYNDLKVGELPCMEYVSGLNITMYEKEVPPCYK